MFFFCKICDIFENILYRTPPVPASGNWYSWLHKIFREKCGLYWDGRDHRQAYFHVLTAFEKLKYYVHSKLLKLLH